jgi:predicted GTPase
MCQKIDNHGIKHTLQNIEISIMNNIVAIVGRPNVGNRHF